MGIVQLRNAGTTPVTFNGNERITLAPGQDRLVPWEFAAAWLGDPNTPSADRPYVLNLVRLSWGYASGMDSDADWEARRPKIEVYDTDALDEDGNPSRVYMMLEDPDGVYSRDRDRAGVDVNAEADLALLRDTVARQAGQLARLEAMLQAKLGQTDLDPATTNALSTADSTMPSTIPTATELPSAVPTPAGATDAPRTPRVRSPRA